MWIEKIAALWLVILLGAVAAFGQAQAATADLTGTVIDPGGSGRSVQRFLHAISVQAFPDRHVRD